MEGSLDHDDELELVVVARDVRARRRRPIEFDEAFAQGNVFVQRPSDRVGVMTAELPGKGRWVLAFSTLPRLANYAGDVQWLATTGADLLEQLPSGLGVLFDVEDAHGLPLLPQPRGRARFGDAVLPEGAGKLPERLHGRAVP